MPTTLSALSPASGEIKVRYQEPYVTEGLNAKLAVLVPRGTYRGFRLAPSVNNLSIVIEADAENADHVAHYRTSTGYALTLRRVGGDFEVVLAASSTLIIALYATYLVGSDTAGEIRSYTLAEWDALPAATREELVALGTVTTPGAGVIPAADITHVRRSMAWESVAAEARPWPQVVGNPTFDYLPSGTSLVGRIPGWSLTQTGGTAIESYAEPDGLALNVLGDAGPVDFLLNQVVDASLVTEQLLRFRVSLRCTASAAGSLIVNLYLRDATTGVVGAAVPIGAVPVNVVDGSYRTVDLFYKATSDGRLYSIELEGAAVDPGAGQSVFIGSVECFLEAVPGAADHLGTLLANYLDLPPADSWTGSMSFARLLGVLWGGVDPALRIQGSDGTAAHLAVGGWLGLGDLLVGSDADAGIARTLVHTRTAAFTLAWESVPDSVLRRARIYVDQNQDLVMTSNAEYDSASAKWGKDVTGISASYLKIRAGGVTAYTKAAAEDTDWDHSDVTFDATHWSVQNFLTDENGGLRLPNYLDPTLNDHAVSKAFVLGNLGGQNYVQNSDFTISRRWGAGGVIPNVTGANRVFTFDRWYVREMSNVYLVAPYFTFWEGHEGWRATFARQNVVTDGLVHEFIQEIDRGQVMALANGETEVTVTFSVQKTPAYSLGGSGLLTCELVAGVGSSGDDSLVDGTYTSDTSILASVAVSVPDEATDVVVSTYYSFTATIPRLSGVNWTECLALRFKWESGAYAVGSFLTFNYVNMTKGSAPNTTKHLWSTGDSTLERYVCRRYFQDNYEGWDSGEQPGFNGPIATGSPMRLAQDAAGAGIYLYGSFIKLDPQMWSPSPSVTFYNSGGTAGALEKVTAAGGLISLTGITAGSGPYRSYIPIFSTNDPALVNHVIRTFYAIEGEPV